MHVAHHSSERYNLSTALRQPVAESITIAVPYSLLALVGVRPPMIEQARALNLIYQFWIHTEAIRTVGPLERVLNTPSHHRVHHGSNRRYLDRNHGSILIVWDKLFGTFEPEAEPVVYGLTRNIDSYNPAGHRHPRAGRHRPRRRRRRDLAGPALLPAARPGLGLRARRRLTGGPVATLLSACIPRAAAARARPGNRRAGALVRRLELSRGLAASAVGALAVTGLSVALPAGPASAANPAWSS